MRGVYAHVSSELKDADASIALTDAILLAQHLNENYDTIIRRLCLSYFITILTNFAKQTEI